jgi:glycosyltransferase involved in cell wall biosynthesis
MKRCLFVFAHPAPYKINLFNGLQQFLDLTVAFERQLGRYSRQQYVSSDQWKFKHFFIKGLNIGQENHLSFALIRHLRQHPYDLIIMNGYSSLTEMITIRYLQKHHIPYYLYVNGGVIREHHGWKYRLKKSLIAPAAGYFSPTPIVDDYLIHYGANPKNIFHYPYSTIFAEEILERPLSDQAKLALRKTVGLPLTGKIILAIGQFIPRKNFVALIKQWRTIDPSIQLIIVGDGREKNRYLHLIRQYKLTHVTLKPFQPKNLLLSMLRASDGFILLSKEDIYGHVVNEALSQGIPVLCSDQVISAKVLVTANQNGLLMPLQDIHHLHHYVHQLLAINQPEQSLHVARQHTIETMVAAHRNIFDTINL